MDSSYIHRASVIGSFCRESGAIEGSHFKLDVEQSTALYPLYCQEINKQREIIALDRQGIQEERPESPTVTPPGVRVNNTRYINSSQGTSSNIGCPQWHLYPPFQAHSATPVCTGIRQNSLLFEAGLSL